MVFFFSGNVVDVEFEKARPTDELASFIHHFKMLDHYPVTLKRMTLRNQLHSLGPWRILTFVPGL